MRNRSPRRRLDMPLLGRELIEQAHRPRTYVLRIAWAVVLFTLFSFMLFARFQGGRTSLGEQTDPTGAMLGQGRAMFSWVLGMQLLGVVVFLPAIMADAITRERERNALDLLLITELRPWDIVAQKLISRLVPMATILLLAMPLLGVAYTYGGVDAPAVWLAVWAVSITCLQVGAICLALSTDAPRTSSAMLSAYIRLPLILLGLLIVGTVIGLIWQLPMFGLGAYRAFGIVVPPFACLLPAGLLLADPPPPVVPSIIFSLPSIAVVVWYLRKSRTLLVDVVMANPAERPTPSFELADVPTRRGERLHGELPDRRPVAWMDRTSHLHVQLRKVFFVAITVDLPIFLLLAANLVERTTEGQMPGLAWITASTWLIGFPVVALIAASAFAAERTGQTLEVLLTTPIPTADLVRQKAAAAFRFALMMSVPIAAAVVTEWALESSRPYAAKVNSTRYIIAALAAVAVYLPLAVWLGLYIGIRVRDRARAILGVLLVVLVAVVIVPMLVDSALAAFAGSSFAGPLSALRLLSPVSVLWINETGTWSARLPGEPWYWIVGNFTVWSLVTGYLRHLCLHRAAAHLGRA